MTRVPGTPGVLIRFLMLLLIVLVSIYIYYDSLNSDLDIVNHISCKIDDESFDCI
jgi:hypothetical protein